MPEHSVVDPGEVQGDGRVVVSGGEGNDDPLPSLEVYEGSSWSLLPVSLPTGLAGHCLLLTNNGLLHVVGGRGLDQDGNETLSRNIITIDLTAQTVTTRSRRLEAGRSEHGCIR